MILESPQLLRKLLPVYLVHAVLIAQAASIRATTQPGNEAVAQQPARCVALEIYMEAADPDSQSIVASIQAMLANKRGVTLKVYAVEEEDSTSQRLKQIRSHFKATDARLPLVYGLNQIIDRDKAGDRWQAAIEQLLRVQVFVRTGCSRCEQAKKFIPQLRALYPAIEFQILDVLQDQAAKKRFEQLANQQRIGGVSFPGFWICQQLVVGFDSSEASQARLTKILERWTFECRLPDVGFRLPRKGSQVASRLWELAFPTQRLGGVRQDYWANNATWASNATSLATPACAEASMLPIPLFRRSSFNPVGMLPVAAMPQVEQLNEGPPPLEAGTDDPPEHSLPLPIDAVEGEYESEATQQEWEVPWLGKLNVKRLGMPSFTILVGLVDGFNPCAMWVLLFLLSILVNLRDRWKILAVAGTFVVISGLAYFAFMAAWLNVLTLVGYLRPVQITLAILAIMVGSVHVKDYFAFKKGISLSIPESAKPGIYARTRQIVMAEHLYGAIIGASVLAVLVNFIELLCTAGLPAMYSQVLTLQEFPAWKNYSYLGLYILAYMLDDMLMVAIVVWTLSKRKLQESQGRWLKLVSGLVVLALGLVLLLKPEWLN